MPLKNLADTFRKTAKISRNSSMTTVMELFLDTVDYDYFKIGSMKQLCKRLDGSSPPTRF